MLGPNVQTIYIKIFDEHVYISLYDTKILKCIMILANNNAWQVLGAR